MNDKTDFSTPEWLLKRNGDDPWVDDDLDDADDADDDKAKQA